MWWFDTCIYCEIINTIRLLTLLLPYIITVFVVSTFKIYCLSSFQVLLTVISILYIRFLGTYSSYIWKIVPFNQHFLISSTLQPLVAIILFCFWVQLFQIPCMSEVIQYLSFSVWLLSLNVFRVHPICWMKKAWMKVGWNVRLFFFFWLDNIHIYVYIVHIQIYII